MSSDNLQVKNILVEVLIEAPLEKVWDTMVVRTGDWWLRDFYTGPTPVGFHIEPKLGGWMFEDWGEGAGLIWGTVSGLQAPGFLQVVGDSSKDWGGPNRSVMTWRLEEADDEPGTTRLRLEHSVYGRVSRETEESLEAGWLQLFQDGLKSYVETGAVAGGAASPPCRTGGGA